jgi:C-terminal processing protease CtpA/Prc
MGDKNSIVADDNQTFFHNVDYYLKDFDDLHLYLIFEGYYGDSYSFDDEDYTYTGRFEANFTAEEYYGEYCETNYSGPITPDVLYLQINGIDEYTPEVIAMDLYKYFDDGIEDVIFDLTCNPGGYIYSMNDMIAFFTDQPYSVFEYDYKYDSIRNVVFDSDVKKIDANLYVLISKSTYSAANVLAGYLQSNGLATILGEDSNGGSSAVEYILGPGGMVIASPSLFHYSDEYATVFEYGIHVDYQVDPTDELAIITYVRNQR